ncbi:MAG: hypothetical protein ACLUTA_14555 [Blautia wexlerae]
MNELGIKIPRNCPWWDLITREFARACSPRLTIVTQPTQQIARRAAEIMLERLDAGNGVEERNYITEKLQTEMNWGNLSGISVKYKRIRNGGIMKGIYLLGIDIGTKCL